MKLRALLAGFALMAASIGFAQEEETAATPTPTPTPLATPTPTPTPRLRKAPTPTPTGKKKEESRIEGTTITRANGTFIGFNFVGNNLVLTFYDAKKRKIPVDVASAVVRWDMKRKTGTDNANFTPAGSTLVSPKTIPPPHTIRFTLLLFKEGSDQAVESYNVLPTS